MDILEVLKLVALLLIAGWFGAFISQVIKRPAWPSSVKLLLALVVAAMVGIATAYLSGDVFGLTAKWGQLTADDVLAFAAVVYTAAATWYRFYFRGVDWAEKLGAWPLSK
jgi:hypothetical protein